MGFRYRQSFGPSTNELMEHIQGLKNTTYVVDSLVKFSGGLPIAITGQTDAASHVVVNVCDIPYAGQGQGPTGYPTVPIRPASSMATTTAGEKVALIPLAPGLLFDVDITPLINKAVATSGSTATAVVAYGGSTSDLNGGFVYIADLNWQAVIETSVANSGAVTITFTPPAPVAVASGMIVSATCFGKGDAPKFDNAAPSTTLSSAFADKSGGKVVVRDGDLSKGIVTVQFASLI